MARKFKNHRVLVPPVILAALSLPTFAQNYTYSPAYPPAPPVAPLDLSQLTYSTTQLDQMLAPIALYPDPLLSEVLAAATYPQDVAAAGQWLAIRPDRTQGELDSQPWDTSVKAICGFPDIARMLAANMMWTESLGTAFVNQQPAVLDSVQRLRLEAQSAQTLKTTPQQTVINNGGVVEILPTQPDAIYCPLYDPALVYSTPAVVTFGPARPYGPSFDLGLDFHQNRLLRDVHFDREHRIDFAHAQPWQRDPHRPIPRPREALYPPPPPQAHRGWTDTTRVPGAFIPTDHRRTPEPAPTIRANDRAITDLPRAPERTSPLILAPYIPQRTAPQPSAPVPSGAILPPTPASKRNERPVTGLPQSPSPSDRGPSENPALDHAAIDRPAPQSAFHPGGDATTTARGTSSMHR